MCAQTTACVLRQLLACSVCVKRVQQLNVWVGKVSWDFDTEPEPPNAQADLDSDEGEEDTLTQLLSKIPSEMLLERVAAACGLSEHCLCSV